MPAQTKSPRDKTLSAPEAQLFQEGNYAPLAAVGCADRWETHAARGLIGAGGAAAELERFAEPEARFYRAAALWIDGQDAEALALLEGANTPHAEVFRALIRKPLINVLAQWPAGVSEPFDRTSGLRDGKFRVRNIAFAPQDIPQVIAGNIHAFYSPADPPDFYIADGAEWRMVPSNIQELPCPVLAQTTDYDTLIHHAAPWLRLMDGIVTPDATARLDMGRIVSSPVCVFPKAVSLPATLPPVAPGTRPNDVLLPAALCHPYHPDMSVLVREVMQLEGVRVRAVDGSASSRSYCDALGASRMYIAHHRRAGAIPQAALDALAMGCAVLAPEACALHLFFGESDGVFAYTADTLGARIRRVLESWETVHEAAARGAQRVRRDFSFARVGSQYLRFLTLLAARPVARQSKRPLAPVRRRTVLARGWLPPAHVRAKVGQQAAQRWNDQLQQSVQAETINHLAREMLLDYAGNIAHGDRPGAPPALLTGILKLYHTGIERFPSDLVLRFNAVRAAFHYGSPSEADAALALARETLRQDPARWRVAPTDDVLPYDFFSMCFNYRAYLDLCARGGPHGAKPGRDLARLILASLRFYVGRHTGSLDELARAVKLDPDFPHYRLVWAQALVRCNTAAADATAAGLLLTLVRNSALFSEAFDLIEEMRLNGRLAQAEYDAAAETVRRIRNSGLILEDRWAATI